MTAPTAMLEVTPPSDAVVDRATGTAAIRSLGTVLGVWAHPDDEAYLSAGLMALARLHGQRVVVATATAGEQGTSDPERWPPSRLAPLRRREQTASLAAIGVSEHHWLGHHDGACQQVPLARAVAQVAGLLAAVAPDTIVTFGPEGMTGHPDHRAVSAWTTRAWEALGRRGRLLYATLTPEFHAEWGPLNDEVGLWAEIDSPPSTPTEDLAVSLACRGALLDRKLDALRAHASQTTGLVDLVGEDTYRRWWSGEWFVDAHPIRSNPNAR